MANERKATIHHPRGLFAKIFNSLISTAVVVFNLSATQVHAICEQNINIDIDNKASRTLSCGSSSFRGGPGFVWTASGFEDDEYFISVYQGSQRRYHRGQFESSLSNVRVSNVGTGGGGYSVRFTCDLEGPFKHCDGNFRFALVNCGCPNGTEKTADCRFDNPDTAADAVCSIPNCAPGFTANTQGLGCVPCGVGTSKNFEGAEKCTPCAPGFYAPEEQMTECLACDQGAFQNEAGKTFCATCPSGSFQDLRGEAGCKECPAAAMIRRAPNVDFSGATGEAGCGEFFSTGYWALAQTGSVGVGGSVVSWSLERTEAVSEGVERTKEFADEFSQAMGQTTSFETTTTLGWSATVSASAGIKGIFEVGASTTIEGSVGITVGEEQHYEVSRAVTHVVGTAVSSVIESSEATVCEQTCGADQPGQFNAFVWNWVEAVFEVGRTNGELLHYVRTCRTQCTFQPTPPQCPPGFCADASCTRCTAGAFVEPEVDLAASTFGVSGDGDGDGGDVAPCADDSTYRFNGKKSCAKIAKKQEKKQKRSGECDKVDFVNDGVLVSDMCCETCRRFDVGCVDDPSYLFEGREKLSCKRIGKQQEKKGRRVGHCDKIDTTVTDGDGGGVAVADMCCSTCSRFPQQ